MKPYGKGIVIFIIFSWLSDSALSQAPEYRTAPGRTGIVIAGSSITWGNGNLCDGFSGEVVDYIMTELSTLCLPAEIRSSGNSAKFKNPKLYKGEGLKITGLHSKVEFDLYGDELAICQAILRTNDHGVMQVKADDVVIGKFTNHNPGTGTGKQSFKGDGTTDKFLLDHPCTYDHEIRNNGKLLTGRIFEGGYGGKMPDDVDYLVIRKFNQSAQPVHAVWFRNAPSKGAEISVSYKYGKVIMFEGSTAGQTVSDETNESNYGDGIRGGSSISMGMEFRYIDKDAFWIHKFTENKLRHFEIEIIDGVNPYFIINYASNRYHDFMNAGIGGWMLKGLLDNDGVNDFNNFCARFSPDIIINESATNDDWEFGERKVSRTIRGLSEEEVRKLWTLEIDKVTYNKEGRNYDIRVCSGLISSAGRNWLVCPGIVSSDVKPGDLIRIGDYHGDNRQVVTREISSVDLSTGKVTWLQPIDPGLMLNVNDLDDLVGKECSIRDLSAYHDRYVLLVDNLKKIAPHAKILITQPGLSNYRTRQLWGYDIVHRNLVGELNLAGTIEVTDRLQEFVSNSISGRSFTEIKADGSREYILPWKGHWQGFEVWVGNRNVYGRDCYIEGGKGYRVDPSKRGDSIEVKSSYEKSFTSDVPMRLVFTRNIPKEGTVRVLKADVDWAGDHCHPNSNGAYVYGRAYVDAIRKLTY